MTKKERAYFNAAKAVSELSDHPSHKLGCVIVDKHRIISSGCNSITKCHPLQARLDTERYGVPCPGKRHAEVDALLPLIRDKVDLKNAAIYVFRQTKNKKPAIAKPCSSCEKLIRSLGIRKVYYTTHNSYTMEKWL